MARETITPEFSVEVDLGALGRAGKLIRLAANEDECRKIADRLNIITVESLEGKVRLIASKTDIGATGVVHASLMRECVASLEPMNEVINEEFDIRFARQAPHGDCSNGEDSEDWNRPELHEGDMFDVGELLVQQLSLAMSPFPRKEGAPSLAEQYGRARQDSPFADLQAVLEKDQKKQ